MLDEIAPLLYTCWPVLTEASHLLLTQGGVHPVEKLLDSCGTGLLEILPLSAFDAHAIAEFLHKYRDQEPTSPMPRSCTWPNGTRLNGCLRSI